MKFVTLATKPNSMSCDQFALWFKEEHVPHFRKSAVMAEACLVRTRTNPLGEEGLAEMGWDGPMPDPTEIAPCDILMEIWLPTGEDFRREILPGEDRLRDIGATFASYAVTPYLQKDPRVFEAGATGRRPEVTFVSTIQWKPTVEHEWATREWAAHAEIAIRRAPALTKYEQNIVCQNMSWSNDYPMINAFGDFAFDTVEDLKNRFRVSVEEIQDAFQFVHLSDVTFFGDAQVFKLR